MTGREQWKLGATCSSCKFNTDLIKSNGRRPHGLEQDTKCVVWQYRSNFLWSLSSVTFDLTVTGTYSYACTCTCVLVYAPLRDGRNVDFSSSTCQALMTKMRSLIMVRSFGDLSNRESGKVGLLWALNRPRKRTVWINVILRMNNQYLTTKSLFPIAQSVENTISDD